MDNIIKLSEFRANTKVFLNAVRDNQPLLLRRGDELFEIKWKGSVWQGIPRETYVQPQPKEPIYMNHGGTAPSADVSDLLYKEHLAKNTVPYPFPEGELECCQHPSHPCKHWVWDIDTGEGYKNTLSGRYREAD